MMPNQIRFRPSCSATGSISGSTISMIDDESMTVPSSRISTMYSSRKMPTPKPMAAIQPTRACGVPLIASMRV